jgi:3-oxoacyl-[acyl-carrier protein] reductase
MDLGLKGKVELITGGATGIGKATALEFLREGAIVAVCGRRQERLDATQKEFAEHGFSLYTKSVDVCDYDAFSAFADEVAQKFGRIDVFINNAGAGKRKLLLDLELQEFKDLIDVNLFTVFYGCRIAAQHMKKTGGGVILNASSFTALDPTAGSATYSAAKAAVLSLTRTFAAELARDNIRVVAYVPGMIATEISERLRKEAGKNLLRDIPMQRFGTPEDLAKMLVFLSSDAAGYINGTHVTIAGAKRCVQNPWYVHELGQTQ